MLKMAALQSYKYGRHILFSLFSQINEFWLTFSDGLSLLISLRRRPLIGWWRSFDHTSVNVARLDRIAQNAASCFRFVLETIFKCFYGTGLFATFAVLKCSIFSVFHCYNKNVSKYFTLCTAIMYCCFPFLTEQWNNGTSVHLSHSF